jgi:hypothetical protein
LLQLHGQRLKPTNNGILAEAKAMYGFIIPHHDEMAVYTNRHVSVFEFSILQETYNNFSWAKQSIYPRLGISYLYSGLGNTPILGHLNALYPFFDFPFIKGEDVSLQFKFGAGLAYFSKKFDRFENYKNTAIGSNLNSIISMNLNLRAKLSAYSEFNAGVSFLHFSNGSTEMPNYGINIPVINTGLTIRLRKNNQLKIEAVADPKTGFKPEFNFIGMVASKEIFPVDGPKFVVGNLAFDNYLHVSSMFKTGLCFDVTYDASDMEQLRRQGILVSNEFEKIKIGANLASAVQLGKLSFALHAGVYLFQKNNQNGLVYDKLSVTYAYQNHYLLNLTLKTHFAKADFVALGFGYRL